MNAFPSKLQRTLGWALMLVGLAALLIPLQHPESGLLPSRRNGVAGVVALLSGALLLRDGFGAQGLAKALRWLALAASPFMLILSLYAALAELEEVVSLTATDASGRSTDLRLWIVDDAGAEWVTMPSAKADAHGLDGARLELLRAGEVRCVLATRLDERETVNGIHRLRHQKYAVQRLATQLGLFGELAGEDTVALRLEACRDALPLSAP